MSVIVGPIAEGRKELVGFQVGMRESAQSPLSGFAGEPLSVDGTRAAGRNRGSVPRDRTRDRGWRRCARVLEGSRRGLPRHVASVLRGQQDGERAEQCPQIHPACGRIRPARHPASRNPGRRRDGHGCPRRETGREMREGRDMPDQGSRGPGGVSHDGPAEHRDHLRTADPPSRACRHALPGNDRKRLRHRRTPDRPNQGRCRRSRRS